MSYRKLIRSLRRAKDAGATSSELTIDNPKLAQICAPFVVDNRDVESRRFRAPLTRVGPVRSGSLREFEDET